MATFKDFCVNNNIVLRRDADNKLEYMDHKVTDQQGNPQTYHIFSGENADGKVLFIPSLNAFADAANGTRKLADLEVVEQRDETTGAVVTAKDGTRLLFLHRPATAAGSIDAGF
jgi:hypothetical protein